MHQRDVDAGLTRLNVKNVNAVSRVKCLTSDFEEGTRQEECHLYGVM